ncbi:hypothetical protein BIW53_10690 [Pseudoalteromonas byunsanensis]|uniref:Uncharacterized protein n=1 Tax=Pseudoalteromonas byunsanensis TaxID=327939 RepID=A0A1S1N910_9GAMM|nr:hypothetical protein BIW53_10690 [Pseudoalteromonas byunsanensis]
MSAVRVYKPSLARRIKFCIAIVIVCALSLSLFFLQPKGEQVEAKVMIANALSIVLFYILIWGIFDLFRLAKGRLEVDEKAIKYGASDSPNSILWEQVISATYYNNLHILEVRDIKTNALELKIIKLYEYQVDGEAFLETLRLNSEIYKFQLNIDSCQ